MKIVIYYGFLLSLMLSAACKSTERIDNNISLLFSESKLVLVDTEDELVDALARLEPGTVLEIADGTYRNVNISLTCSGSTDQPIIIKAKNAGKVIFSGDFQWDIAGSYITISGLYFTNGQRTEDKDLILDTGSNNTYSHCKFNNLNDVRGTFIKLEGYKSIVEYCEFTGKTTPASYVNMDVPAQGGSHHVIRRNYFSRPSLGQNGGSAMRVGHGSMAMHHAYILIEENLFENCDGEEEIVSVKSSRNYIRRNTFRMCRGAFSLRQGRGSILEGNFFIGDGQKRCGGLTIRGRDHYVFNNYFYHLKAKKTGVINFGVASPEDPERIKLGMYPRHFPLTQDIVICYNTIVENKSLHHINFLEGYGTRKRYDLPTNIQFYNNVFDGEIGLMDAKPNMEVVFEGNYTSKKKSEVKGVMSSSIEKQQLDGLKCVVLVNNGLDKHSAKLPTQSNYSVFEHRDLSLSKDVFGRTRQEFKHAGCVNWNSNNPAVYLPISINKVGCGF